MPTSSREIEGAAAIPLLVRYMGVICMAKGELYVQTAIVTPH